MSGPSRAREQAVLFGTLATLTALSLLGRGLLETNLAQRASDGLQLVLAASAAAACLVAAQRGPHPGHAFWSALGLGCLAWAAAQLFWVTRSAPFSPPTTYAEADLLVMASTALFLVAWVMRPDRARDRLLPLLVDVVVVAIAILYVFCQAALVHLLAGDIAGYEAWSSVLFDLRGLALLPAILWAVRHSAPPWTRLYARLAPAFVLLVLGGVVTNRSFGSGGSGAYHAGLYDLPWILPFAWIAVVAFAFGPEARAGQPAPSAVPGWRRTRRATVVAFVVVLLFPLAHILVFASGPPGSRLARWRAGFALAGTLLVAGLYLLRQLIVLGAAEKALREGEERYRALLDGSAVGVYGPDMQVQFVTGALTAVSGYRPEDRIGGNVFDVLHPDDAEGARQTIRAVLDAPGQLVRTVIRSRTLSGSWLHLEADIVNRLAEPAVRGIVANVRDVTERRRAEEERARSLSLVEATLESTADGILVVDRAGRITRFNQRFAAMWRIPREVLERDDDRAIGYVLDQLQEPQAFLDRVQELYQQPEAESFETLRFRDGRVFERYSLPQRLGGEVVGRVWSFRDVTERAHAEEAMARLVAIIEATPDFVATCGASLRTLYVNRAGCRMLGLADDAALAELPLVELHPAPAATKLIEEAVPTALREGAWSGENLLRHRDGREIPVLQVVLAHRSPGGEVDFLSTIARDISQRIEAEQELRRSHTMAALGSLVANVAHEVRNPLFGISSTLDAFEARFARQEEHRQYLRVLREQLERLSGLMNDLLEYAKPTGLQLKAGRLEDVVGEAVAACSALLERSGVTIDTRLAPDLPPLRMDERRLGQVFRNLLENALQHAPSGGKVRLEARVVQRRGRRWAECSIEDDGPGFKPEDLPHVFEPFFTRRHGGTGLGLSIVQRIVADHGGSITARNRVPKGAGITIELPALPVTGG